MTTSALLSHRASASATHFYLRAHSVSDKFDRVHLAHSVQAAARTELHLVHSTECVGVEEEPGELIVTPAPSGSARPSGARHPGKSSWDRAWMLGDGELEVKIWGGVEASTEVSGIPYRFEIVHGRSQAVTWACYIVDDTGKYHPAKIGGEYEGVFGRGQHHKMRAHILWGGREFRYTGWASGFGHQRSNRDSGWFRDMVWSGVDESKPFFAPRKTMPTVRSTRSKVVRKAAVAAEILAAAGGFSVSGLKDGPIRLFHRQSGRYGDWLARLVEMAGQEWHLIGKRVEVYDALAGCGAKFTYSVSTPVRSESYDSAVADVITRVLVRRVQEAESRGAEEPEVCTTFGTYTKSWPEDMHAIQPEPIEAQLGAFSDYIYRNAKGNVVAVRGSRGGVYPAHLMTAPIRSVRSVEYTFGAQAGVLASEGYGRILFRGVPANKPDQEDMPEEFESGFELEVIDQALEDIFGEALEELDVNELIATQQQALEFGQGWLNRRKAALFPLSITVPLNPAIRDGTPITIIDLILNRTHTRPVLTATHSFGAAPDSQWTRFTIGGYLE